MGAEPEGAETPAEQDPAAGGITRRGLLVGGLGALGLVGLGGAVTHQVTRGRGSKPVAGLPPDPFRLGVASGEPAPDGFVLWTRLALDPVAADGLGGMPDRSVPVEWEIASDEAFRRVVRRGTETATRLEAHSVHVEVGGLAPGAEYFYRFRAGGHVSPAGRTRTAPSAGSTSPLALAVLSCANWEAGFFTAYRRVLEDQPDVVLHLGDYVYETMAAPGPRRPRQHAGREPVDLAGYRQRYGQYHTDPDLQALHAAAPWLLVPDDHEVENNYAALIPETGSQTPRPAFPARRAAAYQAWWENLPLRRSSRPTAGGARIYRRLGWGGLATFHLLDTRQYRDDQACGDGFRRCPTRLDPRRTLLGAEQERWLADGLRDGRSRWDLIGQQVFFAERDHDPGPAALVEMDSWDGYAANRSRVLAAMQRAKTVRGAFHPVVLTGDVHEHYANDLALDVADPRSRIVGEELITTSVTSSGDGDDSSPALRNELRINPHMRFGNAQRGYVRLRIDGDEARADFRVLSYVTRPGSPATTRASFALSADEPGLTPI